MSPVEVPAGIRAAACLARDPRFSVSVVLPEGTGPAAYVVADEVGVDATVIDTATSSVVHFAARHQDRLLKSTRGWGAFLLSSGGVRADRPELVRGQSRDRP